MREIERERTSATKKVVTHVVKLKKNLLVKKQILVLKVVMKATLPCLGVKSGPTA